MKAYVSARNGWHEAAPKDPWARRVFGLGAGLFAAGVAKFGVDGLAATPEPKTSTVVLWLAGIIAIGVAKENELG